ncbi:MAG: hypothetical protein R2856_00460 [Caldilineaceae bacterium]
MAEENSAAAEEGLPGPKENSAGRRINAMTKSVNAQIRRGIIRAVQSLTTLASGYAAVAIFHGCNRDDVPVLDERAHAARCPQRHCRG